MESKSGSNSLGTTDQGTVGQMSTTWLEARWLDGLNLNVAVADFVQDGERVLARIDTSVATLPLIATWTRS